MKIFVVGSLALSFALTASVRAESVGLPDQVRAISYDIYVSPQASNLVFDGIESISVEVTAPTNSISMNAVGLKINSVRMDHKRRARVSVDTHSETVTLHFPDRVKRGRHTLSIQYSGRIYQSATGLFAIDYIGGEREERMLITQFEPAEARRFAPMWDEPRYKATFKLSVFVRPGQSAFSNMPVAQVESVPGGGIYHFAETPRMSTYLLFLGVGSVERRTIRAGPVEIGVITRKGAVAQGDFAIMTAKRLLAYYNEYFGVPYPLPKLDLIAAPGNSQFFDGMENWGAILFFEHAVLLDPLLTTEEQREYVFRNVAHEMAHQWFGDFVTMSWWTDLWLNEGYASWFASKVTDAFNPDWRAFAETLATDRQAAMELDALSSTHPIVRDIRTVEQISQAFDAITYRKGEAVIGMLESWMGKEVFRDAIRRYMAKYPYGNTVTDQLWAEIGASSHKPVVDIMHSFTLQGGVPMIRVGLPVCRDGRTTLTLSQDRFGLDTPSRVPRTWSVPVRIGLAGDNAFARDRLVTGAIPQTVSISRCGVVVVNLGQGGYYRTLYAPEHFEALRKGLARLSIEDQVGLIADSYALGNGGYQGLDRYFDLIGSIAPSAPPLLWGILSGELLSIDERLEGLERAAFRGKAAAILMPAFERIGWIAKGGEAPTTALVRQQLVPALGELCNERVVADARRYTEASFANPASTPSDVAQPALKIYAATADAARWELLHKRAQAERNPAAKLIEYRALGTVQEESLARRALSIALTDEAPITTRAEIIQSVGSIHPALAFDWAVDHAEQVNALIDESSRTDFIVKLAARASDAKTASRVQAYSERTIPANARGSVDAIVARIRVNTGLRASQSQAIARWSNRTAAH
jgi:aminopeptidase N